MIKFAVFLTIIGYCASATSAQCACPRNYEPVCGSDGQTYDNDCLLACQLASNPQLTSQYTGPCEDVPTCPVVCTADYTPICGSDGTTYSNKCMFDCARVRNRQLIKKSDGACAEVPTTPNADELTCRPKSDDEPTCPGVCILSYVPICGSDGKTYSNQCEFDCARVQNRQLLKSSDGACPEVPTTPKSDDEPTCPGVCILSYVPICGSDGKTYSNQCAFDCARVQNRQLLKSSDGACPEVPTTPKSDDEPTCPGVCILSYVPICGSDGKTYSNQCAFDCARVQNRKLVKSSDGACPEVPTTTTPAPAPACPCTREYKPVCGNDYRTYNNPCLLSCARRQNRRLKKRYSGECILEPQVPTQCVCTLNYSPVCGTDGNTYSNECSLNCAARQNRKLAKKSDGACQPEAVKVVEQADEPLSCFCTFEYNPVCGTNGITYDNACNLNCDTARVSGLAVRHTGACGSEPAPQVDCVCTREFEPVCGSDGVTYSNDCLLSCAAKNSKTAITLASAGACVSDTTASPDAACVCTRESKLVCGTNRKTYTNECLLKCDATNTKTDIAVASAGACRVNPIDQVQIEAAADGSGSDQVQVVDNSDTIQVVDSPPDTVQVVDLK